MAIVGIVSLAKAVLVKDWVLLLVGLLLVAAGIQGMRLVYARRPNWNGAYWAPPRRREVTRVASVLVLGLLLIAGGQSQSNDQQHAPWIDYAIVFVILAVIAYAWLRTGFKKLFGRSAS